jgi:hypothetical protein
VTKFETGSGTVADEDGDWILADIDRNTLWACFRNWS